MELQEQVLKYLQNNNNETLTQILHLLKPLVINKARKLSKYTLLDMKDLEQDLYIVILKRLKSYNSSKGKFLTYLFNTLRGDPTGNLQSMTRKKRGGNGEHMFASNISLSQPVLGSKGEELTLEDMIADPNDPYKQIYLRDYEYLLKNHTKEEVLEIINKEIR